MRILLFLHVASFAALFGGSLAMIAIGAVPSASEAADVATLRAAIDAVASWAMLPAGIGSLASGSFMLVERSGGRPWIAPHLGAGGLAGVIAIVAAGSAGAPDAQDAAAVGHAALFYGGGVGALALAAMTIARWRSFRARPSAG